MAFDFLKKKPSTPAPKSNASEPTKSSTKVSAKESGFDAQADALKPSENKSSKPSFLTTLKGNIASLSNKVDEAGLGRLTGSKAWYERQWQGVEDAVKLNSFKHTMAHYRTAFRSFCIKELSPENLEAYEAVTEGKIDGQPVSKQQVYERFLVVGAPDEININQGMLASIHKLAQEGKFDSMDFSSLMAPLSTNLSDTYSRFQFSSDLKRWLFTQMTGVEAPQKVGGGKGE